MTKSARNDKKPMEGAGFTSPFHPARNSVAEPADFRGGQHDDEHMENADTAWCPNAGKARTDEKKSWLNDLAKLLSFGGALLGVEKGILSSFGSRRFENVEMLQQIIAGKSTIFATPQTVAPKTS